MSISEWLDGNKTYIGGIGAMLVGAGKFMYDWYGGKLEPAETYIAWFVAGWTIMGFRSAVNKI